MGKLILLGFGQVVELVDIEPMGWLIRCVVLIVEELRAWGFGINYKVKNPWNQKISTDSHDFILHSKRSSFYLTYNIIYIYNCHFNRKFLDHY